LKQFALLYVFLLIFSCFSRKEFINQQNEYEAVEKDSISNYFLFDYINSLTEEDYITQLDTIKKGESSDFFTLRMAYTKTKEYSPYQSDISDSIKKALLLIDSLRFENALSVLKYIQDYNFVNIPSHLYCGFIYMELGDSLKSEYHYNIYDGLLNSIYDSGDGISPETAYIVITTKEEYDFLNWFGLQFNGQSLLSSDGYNFDLMEVTDPETKENFEIYFNVELAFDILRRTFDK
jgi:hypothetical protein